MAASIEAITFDLWDTMIRDETDEPKRAAQGLSTKPVARRALLHTALARHGDIAVDTLSIAYDVADAAFNKVWKGHAVTWIGPGTHSTPGWKTASCMAPESAT